jgi:hypothetical protein
VKGGYKHLENWLSAKKTYASAAQIARVAQGRGSGIAFLTANVDA